ncbi:hypothetical protein GE061_014332 [Apolygus lucorum]|uniref:Carboxylesterase type B domain-containing protein n=1 Tax=Apolygus lucorum TaxID=248454 RepID=A0A8S9XT02_APOLU|nr:hypothetical protein GE061_014332 [Apolygus lucorum]
MIDNMGSYEGENPYLYMKQAMIQWYERDNPGKAAASLCTLKRQPAETLRQFAEKIRQLAQIAVQEEGAELNAAQKIQWNGNWTQLTLPVVDTFLPEEEQYLPVSPEESLSSGMFLKIPILTGVTANDGSVVVNQWSDLLQHGFNRLRQFFTGNAIPAVALKYNLTNSAHYSEIKTILQWYYLDPVTEGNVMNLLAKLVDFYTDAQFKAPHDLQLRWLANRTVDPLTTVYAYQFEQDDNYLYKKLNISGGGHGEELLMIFGPSLMQKIGKVRYTGAEERLSAIMRRFWSEFIRKGSISSSPYGYGTTWNKYSPKDDNYIIFRADNNLPASQSVLRSPALSLTKDAMGRQMLWLWNDLLQNLKDLEDNHVQKEPLSRPNQTPLPNKGSRNDLTYRSAMYTLIAFVIVLLVLLVVCVILLKRHATERERDMF